MSVKRKYFGTDGVRGVANGSLLTPEFVLSLGRAVARVLPETMDGYVVIGRDSRVSGPMLEAALTAGLVSAGRQIISLGVVPTPAVSWIVANSKADFGVMISASHNPVPDNGIKFFSKTGHKLADELEIKIEQELSEILDGKDTANRPVGTKIYQPSTNDNLIKQYVSQLINKMPVSLQGLKVVCDTAWGAAAPWANLIFSRAGAEVKVLHCEPKGEYINVNCGSTNTSSLQQAVIKEQADIGLAFDGDADRLIAIDEKGGEIDGDSILYILATYLNRLGLLQSSAVVGTVMSNMGLEQALKSQGIDFIRAKVGDRYVWEQMKLNNIILGGEQSGHIINSQWAITGDGMLNGLQLAAVIKQSGKTLSELSSEMQVFPQCLINVAVKDKEATMNNALLKQTKIEVEQDLANRGRIVLRPSGTQSIVRVMVEAETQELANSTAQKIADVVRGIDS